MYRKLRTRIQLHTQVHAYSVRGNEISCNVGVSVYYQGVDISRHVYQQFMISSISEETIHLYTYRHTQSHTCTNTHTHTEAGDEYRIWLWRASDISASVSSGSSSITSSNSLKSNSFKILPQKTVDHLISLAGVFVCMATRSSAHDLMQSRFDSGNMQCFSPKSSVSMAWSAPAHWPSCGRKRMEGWEERHDTFTHARTHTYIHTHAHLDIHSSCCQVQVLKPLFYVWSWLILHAHVCFCT